MADRPRKLVLFDFDVCFLIKVCFTLVNNPKRIENTRRKKQEHLPKGAGEEGKMDKISGVHKFRVYLKLTIPGFSIKTLKNRPLSYFRANIWRPCELWK